MIANWVLQATTTTGTGTITLGTTPAGYVPFSDFCKDGEAIPYTIVDGNNRESGYGRFESATGTLVRQYIHETLVSGVYDNTSPTAISLSGNAQVMYSPSTLSVLTVPVTGGAISSPRYFNPANISAANYDNTAGSMPTDTCGVWHVLTPSCVNEIASITIKVGTAGGVGAKGRFGVYSMNETNGPASTYGELITETADLSLESTGNIGASFSTPIKPNTWYKIAYLTNDGTVTFSPYLPDSAIALGRDTVSLGDHSRLRIATFSVGSGWTSMPSSLPSTGYSGAGSTSFPSIYFVGAA